VTDYRGMFDRDYIGSWDLAGRDVTVEIEGVKQGELSNGKQKNKKPILSMVGKEKKLALNKTMCLSIAGMYGNDTRKWVGKFITLYPTTTTFGRQTVDCIRVRESVPRRGGSGRSEQRRTDQDQASDEQSDLPPPSSGVDWHDVLGLHGEGITLEEVQEAFHRLTLEHHPDKGGKHEDMVAVNIAYEKACAELRRG
jgi:hypothetical protein